MVVDKFSKWVIKIHPLLERETETERVVGSPFSFMAKRGRRRGGGERREKSGTSSEFCLFVICYEVLSIPQHICNEWRVGLEIDSNVKREEVERLVRKMMEGEEGREMKKRAMMWKKSATKATEPGGSSSVDIDKMIRDILQEISGR